MGRISSRELTEWQAYDRLEPFGERRGDYRAALVAAVQANTWRGKHSAPAKLEDFLLEFGQTDEAEEMTPEQTMLYWRMLTGRG